VLVIEKSDHPYDYIDGHWYVNFADAELFGYYGGVSFFFTSVQPFMLTTYLGTLLAQDELQVLEHPGLASIREYLLKASDPSSPPKTHDHHGATPGRDLLAVRYCISILFFLVLIQGVQRRMALHCQASENDHHVDLYGNNFAPADINIIRDCVTFLSPPSLSNIVAIEAPKGHRYQFDLIDLIDSFTSFSF
jgi:hypothetical protein